MSAFSASQSARKAAFIALVSQYGVVSLPRTCKTAADPQECLGVNNTLGEPACTWLMLKGRCTDAGGRESLNSPSNCCASRFNASFCDHRDADLRDGMCALPGSGLQLRSNSGAPSLDELKRMLRLSYVAHCSKSQVEDWSCGQHCSAVSGISDPHAIFNTDAQLHAFVAWDSLAEAVLVAFRGTDKTAVKDWATNLDYFKKSPIAKYPDAEVHGGFWDAWQALKGDVVSLIQKVMSNHQTTIVRLVGHSLGGALATNAAVDLKLSYGWSTSVVNFGSPRVGDHEYHNAISAEVPVWRVTHHNDLVPHVPPEAMGFYHAAAEINFPKETGLTYKVCDGSGEDVSCANACSYYLTCDSISDHFGYLDMHQTCSAENVLV